MTVNWKELLQTTVFTLFAVLLLRTAAFASYYIPSESMVPTLEVGDRLVTTKWDYGYSRYSLPLGLGDWLPASNARLFEQLPERGDIVVFKHPHQPDMDMIKRVIGRPGDVIQVIKGRLHVNGTPMERTHSQDYIYADQTGREIQVREFEEDLLSYSHTIIERTDNGYADDTQAFHVPPHHVFVMGDNRDNSADSRFSSLSFVPLENLVGKARVISFSVHHCPKEAPHLTCAPKRFMSLIR
jgi:signal peptidase I